ncbi:hypothetical protein Cadr_000002505 [Camelus dromedarius]|uniref:Uncharacterized protein n=1 Tax=Camelus dromedarius TaxID=9838 RepID=A0A5N4C2M3_CAMDR|nr:hypothetical protein Cadr_000002505 [Camelus dromedarius]
MARSLGSTCLLKHRHSLLRQQETAPRRAGDSGQSHALGLQGFGQQLVHNGTWEERRSVDSDLKLLGDILPAFQAPFPPATSLDVSPFTPLDWPPAPETILQETGSARMLHTQMVGARQEGMSGCPVAPAKVRWELGTTQGCWDTMTPRPGRAECHIGPLKTTVWMAS